MGTAGLEAYQVHGGGSEIAKKFASYFEGDGIGQLEHYDGNDDSLIAYDTNYMPGNDSDAITFGYPKSNATAPGARTIERPESAYVWGAFDAAAQLYELAGGNEEKVSELRSTSDDIQSSVLERFWSESTRMFLAGTSHGATSAATANGQANPLPEDERDLIPAKESNLYDIYAEELIPYEDADKYVDGFRFLRYGDNHPIFPFYTANQYDRAKFNIGGSNNFSNINFTVSTAASGQGCGTTTPSRSTSTASTRPGCSTGWPGASIPTATRPTRTRPSTPTGMPPRRPTTATTRTT